MQTVTFVRLGRRYATPKSLGDLGVLQTTGTILTRPDYNVVTGVPLPGDCPKLSPDRVHAVYDMGQDSPFCNMIQALLDRGIVVKVEPETAVSDEKPTGDASNGKSDPPTDPDTAVALYSRDAVEAFKAIEAARKTLKVAMANLKLFRRSDCRMIVVGDYVINGSHQDDPVRPIHKDLLVVK